MIHIGTLYRLHCSINIFYVIRSHSIGEKSVQYTTIETILISIEQKNPNDFLNILLKTVVEIVFIAIVSK